MLYPIQIQHIASLSGFETVELDPGRYKSFTEEGQSGVVFDCVWSVVNQSLLVSFPDEEQEHACESNLKQSFHRVQDEWVVGSTSEQVDQFFKLAKRAFLFLDKEIEEEYAPEHDALLKETESVASVKQRRGQALYRKNLEDFWDGACAVTGVRIPELLRASHALPWKECKTARDRLSRFNGFLLAVGLDALFDKYLISFDDNGQIMLNSGLSTEDLEAVGIHAGMRLRKSLTKEQKHYLSMHREKFFALIE